MSDTKPDQEILWRQFPHKPDEGFVLGAERHFADDTGLLFLRDQDQRPSGTLLSDDTARELAEVLRKAAER